MTDVKWISSIAAALMLNIASEAMAGNALARIPYDGNATTADLINGGHDIDGLYADIINFSTSLRKDEFENSSDFSRRKSQLRENFFKANGDKFLYVENINYNNFMDYDADNNIMHFSFYKNEIELGKIDRILFLSGQSESFYDNKYLPNGVKNTEGCRIKFSKPMTPDEAKKLKFETSFSYALNFHISKIDDRVSEKIFSNVYDGYFEKEIGFRSIMFTNWESSEIIIFNRDGGEILFRSPCV